MKVRAKTILLILMLSIHLIIVRAQENTTSDENMIFTISGTVSDIQTGVLLSGTTVSADTFSTITNDSGYYSLGVYSGFYDIEYQKAGYQDHTEEDILVSSNLQIDVGLWESIYSPGWVTATVNDDESECLLAWFNPSPLNEMSYDDGIAEDYLAYSNSGSGHAVKFDPLGYPCYVKGAKFYVGDGNFPVGSNFLGSTFTVKILDDDGNNGKPGTTLASKSVSIDNYLWIEVDSFNVEITEGEFYVGMFQDSLPPYAAPIGIDQTMPTYYKSYSYISYQDYWTISSYQDFMIRALVSGDPDSDNARDALAYKVTRFANFDPDGSPANGDSTILNDSVADYSYNDTLFEYLNEGWYAYGLAALYNQNGPIYSTYSYTNIVGKDKQISVTFDISTNTGEIADSAEIELTELEFPYNEYSGITDDSATCTFDPVWKGVHEVNISLPYYQEYTDSNLVLSSDTLINIELIEIIQPPTELYVDPLNSIATWEAPVIDTSSKSNTNIPFQTSNQNKTENPEHTPPTGSYLVLLDGDSIATVYEESYQYLNLVYGQEYTAGISAIFMSGNSDTNNYTFTSEWLYPPENLQIDTNNILFWTVPKAPWPQKDSIPANLIGFNVFMENEWVEYVEYWGGDTVYSNNWAYYILMPGTYNFSVSAVYDLSPYGFPGDEGESLEEGPIPIVVSYGFSIPFIEEWESGDFEENNWEVHCDNWAVIAEEGNPEPTASFSGQPVLENYDCGIVSYPINGLEITDGYYNIDFDLKLEINDAAPDEKLVIRLWENGEWYWLDSFDATESFDWIAINIETDEHLESDFRIGFFCKGNNSSLVDKWQIDNIEITQVCIAPDRILSEVLIMNDDYAIIDLEWDFWFPGWYWWTSYNDGTFENAIASTEGNAGLAQMFTPYETPCTLHGIKYFNSSYEQYQQKEKIYVLSGDGETILAGPFPIENGPADDWVTIFTPPFTFKTNL
ncbi:MAG: carboxypeptidase-like regulatory domain-containing protein [Bacteroidota bacterium]|nr:carboxypeptidase-like regulatory domain-containing protein [Bacteroidota bacterium]